MVDDDNYQYSLRTRCELGKSRVCIHFNDLVILKGIMKRMNELMEPQPTEADGQAEASIDPNARDEYIDYYENDEIDSEESVGQMSDQADDESISKDPSGPVGGDRRRDRNKN